MAEAVADPVVDTSDSPAVETPPAPPAETPAEPKPAEKTPDAKPAEPVPPDAPAAKVPEQYALTLPADTRFDASDLAIFAAEATALGLTQDQAQALVTARATTVRGLYDTYEAEARADAEVGGAKFEETVRLATVGRDWLFPPGSKGAELVTAWFNKTALGSHVEVLRAFARVGKAKQEDKPVVGSTAVQTPARKPDTEVLFDHPTSRN